MVRKSEEIITKAFTHGSTFCAYVGQKNDPRSDLFLSVIKIKQHLVILC